MKGFACIALLILAGCGGSGGDGAPPVSGNPPPLPTVEFRNLAGTAPADAALGQPLSVEWTLPAGVGIASVALNADLVGGAGANASNCVATAGALAATATSATINIPNTCASKTVREVLLRVTVASTAGAQTSATHLFVAPAAPESFRPRRVSLPVLRISTQNLAPVVSRDDYLQAQMLLEPVGAGVAPVTGALEIRGRGNSTWDLPKKPYRLRLAARQALLGMPSNRDWVLLANYSDKSLLRNRLALELGTALGMAWTSRSAFVELYLNERYDGVYLLTENIKVANDRVDIDELDEDDLDSGVITGGYLLEVDFRREGHTIDTIIEQLPIVFQDPEEPAPAQEAYLAGYLNDFERALHSSDFADPVLGYAAYIDVDSFIHWYLVNEIFRNLDAKMRSSCWMYKPRGGKLHMGPLWDFDIAAGNFDGADGYETTGWWIRNGPWFARLFEDPAFLARVRQVWNEIRVRQLPALIESIPAHAASLQQSQLNNFQRWPILETWVWPNNRVPGSYAGEVEYLATWLNARIAWMDAELNP